MPVEIDLGTPPAGYALSSARAEDEKVSVQFREFTSTEDGQHFIQRLEGIPNHILQKISPPVKPSQVDSMLAIVRSDGTATVYVNEIEQQGLLQISRPIEAGQRVTKNDVIDVDRLELNVEIPEDAGVVFIFSVGWRKGLFYDFGPVSGPDPTPRQYDIADIFGQAYCHVLFQKRFSISDSEWEALFAAKWFPFAGLRHESIDGLLSYIRSDWDPDEKLGEFAAEVTDQATYMLNCWRNHSSFIPHIEIIEHAIERFTSGDYVSCTGLLFPRIEGILRTHHSSSETGSRPSQKILSESAVASKLHNKKCLLLPSRFAAYLHDVYFANFDPSAQEVDASRNSIAHGVASPSQFNQKSALIAILVVHQLFYFLENKSDKESENEKMKMM